MDRKFKRVLWGYDTEEACSEVNSVEMEYDHSVNGLEKKLADLGDKTESFTTQIKVLQDEIASYKNQKDEIGNTLLKTYLNAMKNVLDTSNKVRQQEKSAEGILNRDENEKEMLIESYRTLVDKLKCNIEEYKAIFEEYKD